MSRSVRKLRLFVVFQVLLESPDKREVDGSAAHALGVLAMLNDAANPSGPMTKDALLFES